MEEPSQAVSEAAERYVERLRVDTIFGAPQQQGDRTVIPVAELRTRLGYGYGGGSGPAPATATSDEGDGEAASPTTMGGSGAGAGGTGNLRPRGFIELGPTGARWVPIEEPEKLALAGMALAAWIVFWGTHTARAFVRALENRGP